MARVLGRGDDSRFASRDANFLRQHRALQQLLAACLSRRVWRRRGALGCVVLQGLLQFRLKIGNPAGGPATESSRPDNQSNCEEGVPDSHDGPIFSPEAN